MNRSIEEQSDTDHPARRVLRRMFRAWKRGRGVRLTAGELHYLEHTLGNVWEENERILESAKGEADAKI